MRRKRGLTIWLASLLGCVMLMLGGVVNNAHALALPFADFAGTLTVDLDSSTVINDVRIGSYTDLDPTALYPTTHSYGVDSDPFLGQIVSGFNFLGFDYDPIADSLTIDPAASATFVVGENSDRYLEATATNFIVKKWGPGVYSVNALLTNQIYYHTDDSTFMQQYYDVTSPSGLGELLTWDIVFDWDPTTPATFMVNVHGKISPVPEPATIMLMGLGLIGIGGLVRRRHVQKG